MQMFLTNPPSPPRTAKWPARTLSLRVAPLDRGRHPRGHRHHQPRPGPGLLQPGTAAALRFRRSVRGEVRPAGPARPDHHRVVGRRRNACAATTATAISSARIDDDRASGQPGRLRQRPRQLRCRPAARRQVARLPADRPARRRRGVPRARRLLGQRHRLQRRRIVGRMAPGRAEADHPERGILPHLSPGGGRHGGAAHAAVPWRPDGPDPGRRPALVRRTVRPRQPDRGIADRPGVAGLRARRAECAGPLAGHRARRLPRCRAGQDPARAAPAANWPISS